MIFYIVLTLWVFLISSVKPNTIINNRYNSRAIVLGLSILLIFKISISQYSDDSDMAIYLRDLSLLKDFSFSEMIHYSYREPFFKTVEWVLSKITDSATVVRMSFCLLFLLFFFKSLNKIFLPWQVLIVLFTYLNFIFLYSYLTVAIRQGLSIALILLSISYFLIEQRKKAYFTLLISTLFHWSSIPIVIMIIVFRLHNLQTKKLIYIWILSIILYLTNLNMKIFTGFSSYFQKLELYTSDRSFSVYGGANRLDFLLFSAFWLILALFLMRFIKMENNTYERILNFYIINNIYFLLLGFIAYSDRLAVYSWFLIPLLVWYPIFHSKKYKPIWALAINLVVFCIGIFTGILEFYYQ